MEIGRADGPDASSAERTDVPVVDARAMRRAQLAIVYEQGTTVIAMSAVIMIVCALLLYGSVPTGALLAWLAAGWLTLAVRAPLAARCARLAAGTEELPTRLPLGLALLTAGAYGALGLFYDPSLPVLAQLVLILFPVAVTVAVVPSYGNWPPLFFAFGGIVLVPLLLALLLRGEAEGRMLAVPVMVFMLGETMMVRRTAVQVRERIALRLGNEALVRTLTERAAELEVAHAEARRASRAKSEFLARMSHELRTPLNGVLGMSQLLSASELDAEQRSRLATLDDSGHVLLGLVDGLLDMTRLQADELVLRPRPVRIDALLERLGAALGSRAAAAGLTLDLSLDAGIDPRIRIDPARFEQVLTQLIDNGLKFTDRGGVSVRVASTGDARLLVVVEDTGIGMAPELVDTMFELFVQGDGGHSRRHGGTGLGLALVHRLVRLMEGTVRATSVRGIGTRVIVDLPLVAAGDDGADADADADTSADALVDVSFDVSADVSADVSVDTAGTVGPAGAGPAAPRPRVLVAEDNPVNRLVVEAMLEEIGCEVELAHDGALALDAIDRCAPDLVLMDCQMPVLDGYEATLRLRANGIDVPIVALTANALEGDRERCLAAGMDDYLTKPIDRAALDAAVRRWHGLRSDAPPGDDPSGDGAADERARDAA